jgi:YfiH family protein
MITLASLGDLDGIRHGFMTRHGGVSQGIYASLNCGIGSNDDAARVRENRSRALALAGLEQSRLLTAYQIHSPDVAIVTQAWADDDQPRVDAMVTKTKGLALGVLSADCVPVLFADPEAKVVGAAHAGWRGALTGVLQATVAAMCDLGARRSHIHAAVGPCIGAASYEVGGEFPAPFLAQDPGHEGFFRPSARDGHHMFDLEGYVVALLRGFGLAEIEAAHRDTCAEGQSFFSYRRSVLRGEPDYGRHVSLIGLV